MLSSLTRVYVSQPPQLIRTRAGHPRTRLANFWDCDCNYAARASRPRMDGRTDGATWMKGEGGRKKRKPLWFELPDRRRRGGTTKGAVGVQTRSDLGNRGAPTGQISQSGNREERPLMS